MAPRHDPAAARGSARPFRVLAPRSLAPFVLTCEHASARLPFAAPRTRDCRELLASHWGYDIGAWALSRELSRRLRCSLVGGRWSRLLIDLNRKVDDPTLVRRAAGERAVPWNADVGAEQIEERVLRYHVPYHVEVDRLIIRRLVRGVRPLVLAVHSFTPHLDGSHRAFDAGVLFRDHVGLARRLGRTLAQTGLSVRYNQPYSGITGMMYAVERHGTHHGLPCLELEFNQRLFDRPGAAARLGRLVAGVLEGLAQPSPS